MKKKYIYIGVVIIVILIAIFSINFNKEPEEIEELEESEEIVNQETAYPADCSAINLEIVEANPSIKILTIKRGVGEGDLDKIQVKINGDISQVGATNVKENKEQVFVLDIESGDTVEISAILKDRTVCQVADTITV